MKIDKIESRILYVGIKTNIHTVEYMVDLVVYFDIRRLKINIQTLLKCYI